MRRLLLVAIGWLSAFALLALALFLASNPILPSLSVFVARLGELASGPLWRDLYATAWRSMLAFLLALAAGIVWSAVFPPRRARSVIVAPWLLLLQASPVIFWIIPLVLLLGSGNAAPVAAAVFVVLPLIAFEFRTAFEMTSRDRREFWRHYVPHYARRLALRLHHEWRPYLASATGMGLLMAFKVSALAEWFAAPDGVGRALQQSFVLVDTATFFAYALAFLLIALSLTALAENGMRHLTVFQRLFISDVALPHLQTYPQNLHLKGVGFRFGKREILRSVDFTLKRGEIVILTGASGSGKSTLARIAAGLQKPQQGSVNPERDAVCLVFQGDFLFPAESVRENVAFSLAEADKAAAESAIRLVGLEPDALAGDLSGGMRRRLALARALVSRAPFLLLDEPFTGLDAEAVRQLLQVIRKQAEQGRGILLITHQVTGAMRAMAQAELALDNASLKLV